MLRIVQVSLPASSADTLRELLEAVEFVAEWQWDLRRDLLVTQIVVKSTRAEALVDLLEQRFGSEDSLRAHTLRVQATVSTFLWRGLRPRTWWEKDQARRNTHRAIALCGTLVAFLAVGP